MSTRKFLLLPVLAGLALGACGEQQTPESVAGPSFAPPVDPQACAPTSLNSQITAYFSGSTSGPIKTMKDAMLAKADSSDDRVTAGFQILQEIGKRSRNQAVDTIAGSALAQGIIKCMYNIKVVKAFVPTFPSSAIYNFAPALSASKGGAFYTRGSGTGDETPVQAALGSFPLTAPEILSGVNPLDTWASALDSAQAKKALIYGYRTNGYPFNDNPFEFEWATIPPGTSLIGGAEVALCDGLNPDNAMVHESNIGVLGYQSAAPICAADYSLTLKDTGWGPRALAARLARVVVDAIQPQPLQAAMKTTGTGGTASTFKSKFKKNAVETITLSFYQAPPATMKQNQLYTVKVFVSADVNDPSNGINGACVYLRGANNNGTNTALIGPTQCDNTPAGGVSVITATTLINGQPKAGYAVAQVGVTKTGQLIFTASGIDGQGSNTSGVLGRSGQTFFPATSRTNVKP
jgi:hypothetical protein